MCQHHGHHHLVIDVFTLLYIEGANHGEIKPRVPNIAVEITRGYQPTLQEDKIWHNTLHY